jgi:hypothetical protein
VCENVDTRVIKEGQLSVVNETPAKRFLKAKERSEKTRNEKNLAKPSGNLICLIGYTIEASFVSRCVYTDI